MIHFDTNALIYLPHWARAGHTAVERVAAGEPAAVCAVVWYEFLLGPLQENEASLARAFLQERIVAVSEQDAHKAAELFSTAGRQQRFKTDALVAACAIGADAEFVTANVADFKPFVPHGLRLLETRPPPPHDG